MIKAILIDQLQQGKAAFVNKNTVHLFISKLCFRQAQQYLVHLYQILETLQLREWFWPSSLLLSVKPAQLTSTLKIQSNRTFILLMDFISLNVSLVKSDQTHLYIPNDSLQCMNYFVPVLHAASNIPQTIQNCKKYLNKHDLSSTIFCKSWIFSNKYTFTVCDVLKSVFKF